MLLLLHEIHSLASKSSEILDFGRLLLGLFCQLVVGRKFCLGGSMDTSAIGTRTGGGA